MAETESVDASLQSWLNDIAAYERDFKSWSGRVDKILKRYRDENRKTTDTQARFNILWSNVQTLVPATFSRLPQPDVSRRFRDNDPVGRVAALILERALDFEVQHYPDYRSTMDQSVLDRFLGGRGTAWARYEPHIKAVKTQEPEDGTEVTEDIDEQEELEYECAPVDYVHWKDFGHSVARTWEEVPRVWRKVYMSMPSKVERFGEETAAKIPKDSKPKDGKSNYQTGSTEDDGSWIYEGWDKEKKQAVWFHKNLPDFLDVRPDPLGLEGFFPCPKPLYATLTNDSLIPVPDFTLYQDQANELDLLSDRIDGLVKALQVKGVHDASISELGRLFTEANNGQLIPVKNWLGFAEKQGLKGAIDIVDLTPIAGALAEAYKAMEQVKSQVYEITGIADIIRGQGEASETATATQIKGQYASLRLRSMQESVAVYATDLLKLKAQIMCLKFDPQTLLKISAADQLSDVDKQMVPQALALLIGPERMQNPEASGGPNPLRSFRIGVAADTLVQLDEESEKQNRTEFLTAVSGAMDKFVTASSQVPEIAPLALELIKFGVTGFKVGKNIEGLFDQTMDQLKAVIAKKQENPPPDPEMAKIQAQQQTDQARIQADQQTKASELQFEAQRVQLEAAQKERQQQLDFALRQRDLELSHQREMEKISSEMAFQKWKAELDAQNKVLVAEVSAKATVDSAQLQAAKAAETP